LANGRDRRGILMKIIFFGTGKFGLPTLKKLLASDHEVTAVVTSPDKKRGRGMSVMPTLIKAFVEKASPGLEILQPEKASCPDFVDQVKNAGADIFIVVDFGQILTPDLLKGAKKYCINLHPSLLPKYRGAAPLNRAILNGETETGNTVIKMNERMDAGSMIARKKTDIGENETASELSERLSASGADLVLEVLKKIELGQEDFVDQEEAGVSYAPKLTKKEGKIDWNVSAEEIMRKVRGMQPWPGAYTDIDGRILKIVEAEMEDGDKENVTPGEVVMGGQFMINAAKGAIKVIMLQLEGKKAMTAEEFLRGHRLEKGTVLGKG